MENNMTVINLCLNTLNCLTIVVILGLTIRNIGKSENRKSFLILLVAVFIFNLADSIGWSCEGTSAPWKIPVYHIANFVYYISSPLIFITFMRFISGLLKENDLNNKFYISCISVCLLSILMAFFSCYPGLLYTISADNIYTRGPLYFLWIVSVFAFFILCIAYIVSNRSRMDEMMLMSVLSFPTLPIIVYIPQIFFYGIATVNFGMTVSLVLVYVSLKNTNQLEVKQDVQFSSEFFKKKGKLSFAEKVRRFAFSYGFSSSAIASIDDELQNNINETLKIVVGFSGALLAGCFAGSFFSDRLEPQRMIYLTTSLLCIGLFLLYQFATKKKLLLTIISYIFFILIFAVNIYKCLVLTPDEAPLLFVCVLFMTPSLFSYMPYIIWLIDFSAVFIYMDLARIYKTAESASFDSLYLSVLTLLGIIVGYSISKTKINSIYLTKNLDNEVAIKTKQLNAMSKEIVTALTSSIESKDEYTNGHSERVANYSVMLAVKKGWSEAKCDELWMEAILHDVGKIGVPDNILKKTERLTDEEFKIIQSHTTQGAKILENLASFPKAKEAAHFHHERINGHGYPEGLNGDAIPMAARIVSIADAYDAMTTSRCYRPALANETVMNELRKGRGTQFDAELLDLFIELLEEHGGSLFKES